MKPEDELVLRAARWTWWQQFLQQGRDGGVDTHQVTRTLGRLLPDKWRRDPYGRVAYRLNKLVKMGLLAQASNRFGGYQLTATTDPEAISAIAQRDQVRKYFDQRVAAVQDELDSLVAYILPGSFALRVSGNRTPVNNPQAWTMSVSCSTLVPNLKYILKLAKNYLDSTEPEPLD